MRDDGTLEARPKLAMVSTKSGPHVVLVVPDDRYFWTHRLALARRLEEEGYDLTVAVPDGEYFERIQKTGLTLQRIRLSRKRSAWTLVSGTWDLWRLLRRRKPDLVHLVSMRAVLFGGLAARLAGVEAKLCLLGGLGSSFISGGPILRRFLLRAYRWVFGHGRTQVVFQNQTDRALFLQAGLLAPEQSCLIPGSGVDLNQFPEQPEPEGEPVVLFAGRLIRDKGVVDLLQASQRLHRRNCRHQLHLAGSLDPGNPSSLSAAELQAWLDRPWVRHFGWVENVPERLAACHVACLPSYREGLSLFLLEAAAAGRPLVTTDVAGCRETVLEGESGFLVPVGDPEALAEALERLLLDPSLRRRLGSKGRALVAGRFSQSKVLEETLSLYRQLCAAAWLDCRELVESRG
ncbi:MAG: glycosyltransferase family 1 protein [Planctomycetota bacterium]|nr:MAG: glycosyltransferase family 1 protein [Planctomycetota bacterium]